jgi:hypothetical protein
VKSADIISNVSEILDDHRKVGDEVFSNFNAPKEKTLEHYYNTIGALLKKWEESPLAPDLRFLAGEIRRLGGKI